MTAKRVPVTAFRTLKLEVAGVPASMTDEQITEMVRQALGQPIPVVVPPTPEPSRTWRSKKERAAGLGHPCTVPGKANCGRRDLRTPHTGGSHTPDPKGWHTAAK